MAMVWVKSCHRATHYLDDKEVKRLAIMLRIWNDLSMAHGDWVAF